MSNKAMLRGVRPVNHALLAGLTVESNKIFPLPGSVGRRLSTEYDPRLSGLKGLTPIGLDVVYYEHIATIRHATSDQFWVAFRETMDAFLARQPDLEKHPEWLMKREDKQNERHIHVYKVTRKPSAVMTSHEDWLQAIPETPEGIQTFDTLVYFLAKNDVIDNKVLENYR